MGNYNGTITCGYCYTEGHNSRTCPTKLERTQKRFESAKESGEHVEYYARQVARMTGTNPDTGAKRSRRNEYNGRVCSYCKEGGHNRRKCELLSKDHASYECATRDARLKICQWAQSEGVGVGAMLMYKEYYTEPALMLVESINLRHTHARFPHYEATLRPMNPRARKVTITVKPAVDRDSDIYNCSYEVVGPLTAEQMTAQIGEDWAHEEVDYKGLGANLKNNPFEKGAIRCYHYWSDHS